MFILSETSREMLAIFLIAVTGYLIGRVHIKGISLGSSGIFLAGLLFGHFGVSISPSIQTLGLLLFNEVIPQDIGRKPRTCLDEMFALEIDSLVDRVASGEVDEVILALSTTMEGDTTNFFLYKKLAAFDVRITTIARGVSVGDEIEYADEVTLGRSILNRTSFKDTLRY